MYLYFSDSYMWSHATLLALGTIPWGGGEIGEIDTVGQRLKTRVGDNGAWYEEWHRMAVRVEALAAEAAKARHDITARETYLRACNYYHLAERFLPPQDERKLSGYKRALSCFAQAASCLTPPVERVEIPYEGSSLPAYFVPAEGVKSARAPVVIFFDGLDATKEQLYLIGGRELVKRGLACSGYSRGGGRADSSGRRPQALRSGKLHAQAAQNPHGRGRGSSALSVG